VHEGHCPSGFHPSEESLTLTFSDVQQLRQFECSSAVYVFAYARCAEHDVGADHIDTQISPQHPHSSAFKRNDPRSNPRHGVVAKSLRIIPIRFARPAMTWRAFTINHACASAIGSKHWNPYTGRFKHDCGDGDCIVVEPIGELQVDREGAKRAYWLIVASRRYGDAFRCLHHRICSNERRCSRGIRHLC